MTAESKKDRISLLTLIGANLIPVAGIFLFDWDVTYIVLLYWLENLIVGFYNILKMALFRMEQRADNFIKLFYIPFFCIHYGGFCAVHGFFLTTFFKIGTDASPLANNVTWWGPLVFLQLLYSVVARFWASGPPELIWGVAGLFISHGISFVENYIGGREYITSSMSRLMHQPYQRIVIMHLAIIAGGIFVMKLDSPVVLMLILVILKIGFDLHLHNKSHRPKKKDRQPDSNHSE
jgi:hypothetical protein